LREIFESDPGFQVVGEAADGVEAVLKSQSLHPDLILLDVNLPRKGGITAAREISKLLPKSRVLFFSSDGHSETVRSALSAAGHGYLLKTDVASELIAGARAVLKGEKFLSSGVDGTGAQSVTQR
jgi:NarL family two-component system response regulator LiaR